jgi:hypothetical protein
MIKELDDYGLSYDSLTKEQKDFFKQHIWNGVGSKHFIIDPHDLIFKEASIYHDFFYWRGGTTQIRKLADKDFLHRCHSSIRRLPKKRRPFYYLAAYVYYTTLRLLGKFAWESGPTCQTWQELLVRYINSKK